MTRELSELLTDLSEQAKMVEDAFAAIAVETDAAAEARRDRSRAAAVDRVDPRARAAGDSVSGHWHALQDAIAAEVDDVQQGIANRRHTRDVNDAQKAADIANERAVRSVAVAKAAVSAAGAAVLDAAVAQRQVEALARQ
ncbi:MAG: hypothetical protein KC442_13155 [Thermomicrobiales bacterium]|nr:hypothetical protein [Thermomicrobiales bacterium]